MRLTKSKLRLGKAARWQFFLQALVFNIVYCIGWYTKWRRLCYGYWVCKCDATQMPDEGRTADACVSWPDIFNGFGGPCTFFFYFSTSAWTSLHWIGLSVNIRKQNILVRTSESI